jgi:hypothetical protein
VADMVRKSIETVKYRLGQMDDVALKEISISSHTRDVFCKTSIDLTENKETFVHIDLVPLNADNQGSPVIHYNPVFNKLDNENICLKFTAHECGHALHFLHDDTDFFKMAISHYMFLPFYLRPIFKIAQNSFQSATQKISRRQFLKNMSCHGLELTAANAMTEMVPTYFSRQIERKADHIADALMPEYTLKEALTDFEACCINTDIYRVADTTETFPELHALFAMHPSHVERFAASEQNCKKFAKNSLLWD